jgi:glycosyltransferase involved in cell wall biosynthesis
MPEDKEGDRRSPTGSDANASVAQRLAARVDALEAQNRELAQQMAALLGSTSWRMTRPVRGVMDTLRRGGRPGSERGDPAGRLSHGTHGRGPRHKAGARPAPSPKAHWVLDTGLFDAEGYRDRAGLGAVDDLAAAEHYVSVGERRGLAPNAIFDPDVYADLHREVAGTDIGLLIHYARYGRAEGRLARFEGEAHLRQGAKAFDPGRKTVLLVCHEASRTGAPILGWNLARHLNRDHNLVIAILHPEGDLLDRFVEEASVLVGPFASGHLPWFYMTRVGRLLTERFRFDFAIANSIECEPLLVGLAAANVPTVTLVHEYAASLEPPSRMTAGLMLSTQVVFDVPPQQQSALDLWPGVTTRNQCVFHQGASEVPADSGRASRRTGPGDGPLLSVEEAVRGKDGRPVVLGLGTVSMRKGTDLFVSCAQAVAKKLGAGRVRFVWIGHVPKPHPEGAFMKWLENQVKRSGLGEGLVFLDAVDDLAGAYAAAAVVLVSSRLDPFPNVAMDAALAGVPVICFADANGFADYLAEDERTRALSVPYLDVDAAASTIVDLIGDAGRREAFGAALLDRGHRDFPMERYLERLQPVIDDAKAITAQERRDIDLLLGDGTFSSELWLNPHERFTRGEAVRLHVRKAASGQEANQYCRRPALGFVPQTYADHHPDLDAVPYPNPLAHWIGAGKPGGPWSHPVLVPTAEREAPRQGPGLRTALHIHLHYPELAEGLLGRLAVNQAKLDLFISTTSDAKAADLREIFAGHRGGAVVVETCPNRGRDVGPMLSVFAEALQGYDVFGHVHGKRSLALTTVGLGTNLGVRWYEFLLQHLVGDMFPMVDLILDRFAASERLGLVFPEDPNLTGWSKDRDIARELAARMAPTMTIPRSIDFPIGTMFWARPAALKPLFDLKLGWDDYPKEPVPIDGTMLHALERLLPVIAAHEGYDITTTHIPGVTR